MFKKIGGLIENHIEKIILIVVGVLCAWILVTRVLLSPNVVLYPKDKKSYPPAQIDKKIFEDAKELIGNRVSSPVIIGPNKPEEPVFAEKLENPLKNINPGDIYIVQVPPKIPVDVSNYKKPVIGNITDVDVEFTRAAAYQPTAPVTRERPYQDGDSEPNDVDFVTVSAKFDLVKLYDEFYNTYVATVKDELADPCYAKPIIAGVKLMRQQLNPDGTWSDWQNVPKAKIDYNRDLYKIIETSSSLREGGLEIIKIQLDNKLTQLELLQPEPYQIASAREEWFPPKLHRAFLSAQKKDDQAAKLDPTLQDPTRINEPTGRRGRGDTTGGLGQPATGGGINNPTTTRSRRSGSALRGGGAVNPNPDPTGTGTTTGRRTTRQGRGTTNQPETGVRLATGATGLTELQVDKVYKDFEAIVLTQATDLSKMTEPVEFWAFDDTVEPEQTYQYRLQVGVLNPVPTQKANDMVFWSEPSSVTSSVSVPGKIYFFPRAVQEAAKTVTLSVYKLALGYWYKEDFKVSQGEMIGNVVDIKPKETNTEKTAGNTGNNRIVADSQDSVTVDFNTGAMMVDVARIYEWSGNRSLAFKQYHDMMYSYDGMDIRHMPVTSNTSLLPPEVIRARDYVDKLINEKREPLRAWGANQLQLPMIRTGQSQGRAVYRP